MSTPVNKQMSNKNRKPNKVQAVYTSNYDGCEPERIIIGEFRNESAAAKATLKWMLQNEKGGFEMGLLRLKRRYSIYNEDDDDDVEMNDFDTIDDCLNYYLVEKGPFDWTELDGIFENLGDANYRKKTNGWNVDICNL